jgi:polysaccharide export outer membrane protein
MELILTSFRRSHPGSRYVLAAIAICIVSVTSTSSLAQTFQLSPAQQQMLNQLPPAQREQAMDAMRQLESQQMAGSQQSINEPIQQPNSISTDNVDDILTSVEATAQSRSRLVINFTPVETLTTQQLSALNGDTVLQKLIGSHLFVLDDSGVLSLQDLEVIPLLGLSEADINRRLMAEPFLSSFSINVRILSQEPIGVEALQPFGYDVFKPGGASLSSPSSGPVPPDYVLGPGDSIRVQLFGNVNGIYEYEVSRDGILHLPEIGPVTVAGLPFSEFRADLNKRVQEMLIGTQVSVTMGQLRTIRVYVLGDVNRPGSVVVSGLETMTGALYHGGGVSSIGSLRNIQLKRNGKVVSSLDAYDLLIRGDTSGNSRLQPGDVIFVPPIGKTVSISGAVNRPAIYEVKRLTTAADLVGLAGGLTPEAYAKGARLQRIDESGERTILSVNLNNESANTIRIIAGDALLIPAVLPEVENAIALAGHVHRPGDYPWYPGMRLTDLIESTEKLKFGVDMGYVLIRREGKKGEPITTFSANLSAALQAPDSADDLALEAGDTVNVFSLALGRQRMVQSLLEELALQATIDLPTQQVEVSGNVRAPGVYPLESEMRVSDLIRAGGNFSENAYVLVAELTRYTMQTSGARQVNFINIDLNAIRRGDESADVVLREYDYLIIKRAPEWDSTWVIELEGEVVFPGAYRVRRDEVLAEVIERAGGLTPYAFPEGAVFLRESLKEREQEQIISLTRHMQADLTALSMQSVNASDGDSLRTGQLLLEQLQNSEAVGRLVIDLQNDVARSVGHIMVRNGDRLLIPMAQQVVTVLGETQQSASHLYQSDLSRDDYINLSGGLTRKADKKFIYIVRANGEVVNRKRSRWSGRRKAMNIRPGDTIVVPLDINPLRPLTLWTNVTQILYQSAIAVAAVNMLNK